MNSKVVCLFKLDAKQNYHCNDLPSKPCSNIYINFLYWQFSGFYFFVTSKQEWVRIACATKVGQVLELW